MTFKKLEALAASPMFLAMTILMTCSAAARLFSGALEVFDILFAIGMWLIFAAAKQECLAEKQTGLKMVSGTVKATYIVMWVVTGIFGVVGLLLMFIGPVLAPYVELVFQSDFFSRYSDFVYDDLIAYLPAAGIIFLVIFGAVFLLCAIAIALVNVFFYGNLHKFTKSVCVSCETGHFAIQKAKVVKTWCLVLAIISAISTLTSLFDMGWSLLASGCSCAVGFLAYFLIGEFDAPTNIPVTATEAGSSEPNVSLPSADTQTNNPTEQTDGKAEDSPDEENATDDSGITR